MRLQTLPFGVAGFQYTWRLECNFEAEKTLCFWKDKRGGQDVNTKLCTDLNKSLNINYPLNFLGTLTKNVHDVCLSRFSTQMMQNKSSKLEEGGKEAVVQNTFSVCDFRRKP